MSAGQVGVGTLASAVLGVGTGVVGTGASISKPESVKVAAAQITQELARTGTSTTVELIVLAALLLIAGMLLVSLSRRHAPRGPGRSSFDPPRIV
jgi:LPXTG-motif cell wall-anchored protein